MWNNSLRRFALQNHKSTPHAMCSLFQTKIPFRILSFMWNKWLWWDEITLSSLVPSDFYAISVAYIKDVSRACKCSSHNTPYCCASAWANLTPIYFSSTHFLKVTYFFACFWLLLLFTMERCTLSKYCFPNN